MAKSVITGAIPREKESFYFRPDGADLTQLPNLE